LNKLPLISLYYKYKFLNLRPGIDEINFVSPNVWYKFNFGYPVFVLALLRKKSLKNLFKADYNGKKIVSFGNPIYKAPFLS